MKKLLFAAALATLAISGALAADFDTKLTQIDGAPFVDQSTGKPEEKPTTLRSVAVNSLLAAYPDETTLAGDIKLQRFDLAKKIQDAKGDLKLAPSEVSMLRALILKGMPIVVAGQAVPLIEK